MKRFLAITLALAMVIALAAACGNDATPAATDGAPAIDEKEFRIALVTHSPESILDDGSFNEGSWNGINEFIAEHGISSDNRFFVQPISGTDDARIDLVESTIEDRNATALVLPGFDWAFAAYEIQTLFPDNYFIVLDAEPVNQDWEARVDPNLVAILYAEEQSGFLAGYAAVKDGYTELGFIGGRAVPAVVRFGHGFIQGAELAAEEMGLADGSITIRYHYAGTFVPDPAVTTLANSWYADGTEVIFVAAGGVLFSVIPAAEASGGLIIGVDVDQSGLSPTIITSAVKELAVSVRDMLNDILKGTFKGGQTLIYDAAKNGVGLPMASSKFNTFTQAEYDAIFTSIANGTVKVSASLELSEIATAKVTVLEQ